MYCIVSCPPSLTIWDTAGLRMSERRGQTPRRIRVAGAGVGGVVESCVTRWLISRIDPRTAAESYRAAKHRQPAGNSPRPENYCSSLQETTRDFFANYLYFGTYSEEFQGVRSLRSEFMSSEKVCENSSPYSSFYETALTLRTFPRTLPNIN